MEIEIKSEPRFPILGNKKFKLESDKDRFARVVYDHKTGGEVNVMSREQFENFKSFEPGRHGRSSLKTRSKSSSGSSGGLGGI